MIFQVNKCIYIYIVISITWGGKGRQIGAMRWEDSKTRSKETYVSQVETLNSPVTQHDHARVCKIPKGINYVASTNGQASFC